VSKHWENIGGMRQMPGAAEAMNGAAHDGKEDPSFIVGRLKEQAAFCERRVSLSARKARCKTF
jgi:hypothetical protein